MIVEKEQTDPNVHTKKGVFVHDNVGIENEILVAMNDRR